MSEDAYIMRLKQDIRAAEEALEAARTEIEKAEAADIDVRSMREKYEAQLEKLAKLKAVYLS